MVSINHQIVNKEINQMRNPPWTLCVFVVLAIINNPSLYPFCGTHSLAIVDRYLCSVMFLCVLSKGLCFAAHFPNTDKAGRCGTCGGGDVAHTHQIVILYK